MNVARLQDELLALKRRRAEAIAPYNEQIAAKERELDEALAAELRGGAATTATGTAPSSGVSRKPQPSGRLDVFGELERIFDAAPPGTAMGFDEMQQAATIEIPIPSLRACVARNSGPKGYLERAERGKYRKRMPKKGGITKSS